MKIVVNANVINYLDLGDKSKPVLVFLHGWLDNMYSFEKLSNLLGKDFRCILVDLPGFGGSSLNKRNFFISDYVDSLSEFIKKTGLKPYAFIGHSFGGRILIKGFGTNILSAEKLILIGSAGIKESNRVRNKLLNIIAKLLKVLLKIPVLNLYEKNIKSYLYNKIGSDAVYSTHLKDVYQNTLNEDLQKYAKNINTETLLLYGENDVSTPVKYGQIFNKLIKNSHFEIIKDGNHFVHNELVDQVADLIKKFLL